MKNITKKRSSLIERRERIAVEIMGHDHGDNAFAERLEDLLKISGDAYRYFQKSNIEEKRRLVNLVFLTV